MGACGALLGSFRALENESAVAAFPAHGRVLFENFAVLYVLRKGAVAGFVVRFNAGKNLPVDCTRCGSCVEACPQGIDILECFDRIQDEIFSVAPTTQVLMKYNTLPKGN